MFYPNYECTYLGSCFFFFCFGKEPRATFQLFLNINLEYIWLLSFGTIPSFCIHFMNTNCRYLFTWQKLQVGFKRVEASKKRFSWKMGCFLLLLAIVGLLYLDVTENGKGSFSSKCGSGTYNINYFNFLVYQSSVEK